MFKDWIGPDGYSDFQKGEYFCVPYKGGHAVFSLYEGSIIRFACTVWDDGRVGSGGRKYCPEFSEIPNDFEPNIHYSMPEPVFELDEIHAGGRIS